MNIEVIKGTGLAHCRLCKELIEKGDYQVRITGYRDVNSVHLSCLNKLKECDK